MRRVLTVVMDGVGVKEDRFGNAVMAAKTPNLDALKTKSLYRTLLAHGTAVGLPSDTDIGNSEVGHNALGAGRVFDQGAKLVQNAIQSKSLYQSTTWRKLIDGCVDGGALHFIGLLSDGNVHSHENHLYAMMKQAVSEGVKRMVVHPLLDGRDVGEKSAETYVANLESLLQELVAAGVDAQVGSGGGRMEITMDRYNADWSMVKRGWDAHVLGHAPHKFHSISEALKFFRQDSKLTDQYLPAFVIVDESKQPVGTVEDGDSVVMFNFRGDRAIEISRAFTEIDFSEFDRIRTPEVFYAGMMQYDGDLRIPEQFLVQPPLIDQTLGAYLSVRGVRQFACSETQKFGHVTYFWNGNRSGKFDEKLETYVEIPSDIIPFDQKPEMKAQEITQATIRAMKHHTFDFGRINLANGDMVGHTGVFEAAVRAMETVDHCIGQLMAVAEETDTILLITADHGNCDEMFSGKEDAYPNWQNGPQFCPPPKTAHSINPVPCYIFDPKNLKQWRFSEVGDATLANIANTVLVLMGLPRCDIFLPSLVEGDSQ